MLGGVMLINPHLILESIDNQHFDSETFHNLANFPIDRQSFFSLIINKERLPVNDYDTPRFIFTTYSAISCDAVSNLLISNANLVRAYFDEAQYIHNNSTIAFKKSQKLVSQIKMQNPNFTVTLSTGTPLENSFVEVWHLLSLAHPNQFNLQILRTLSMHLERAKKAFNGEINDFENMNAIIQAFIHFHSFAKVIQPLIQRVSKADPMIREQWEGCIPEKRVKIIDVMNDPQLRNSLSEYTLKRLKKNQKKFKKFDRGTLEVKDRVEKLLIHHDLENAEDFDKDTESTLQRFLEQMNSCSSEEELNRILKLSPINNVLFNTDKFNKILAAGEDVIIFVHYRAHAKLLEAMIKVKYQGKLPEVHIYSGEQSMVERNEIVNWFNELNLANPCGRVLITSLKAGGVGLNFPRVKTCSF